MGGSRKWEYNFGDHQYTDSGKPSEFARRQYRSSKLMQRPVTPGSARSYFFQGINTSPSVLDQNRMPSQDRYMETVYCHQTGLTQPLEIPDESGFRCKNELPKEVYRDFASRRSNSARSISSTSTARRRDRHARYADGHGKPAPNWNEQASINTLRCHELGLPYYLGATDYHGPPGMHHTVDNIGTVISHRGSASPGGTKGELPRRSASSSAREWPVCPGTRVAKNVPSPSTHVRDLRRTQWPSPHGVTAPPKCPPTWDTRDNWDPVGKWMNGSGYA